MESGGKPISKKEKVIRILLILGFSLFFIGDLVLSHIYLDGPDFIKQLGFQKTKIEDTAFLGIRFSDKPQETMTLVFVENENGKIRETKVHSIKSSCSMTYCDDAILAVYKDGKIYHGEVNKPQSKSADEITNLDNLTVYDVEQKTSILVKAFEREPILKLIFDFYPKKLYDRNGASDIEMDENGVVFDRSGCEAFDYEGNCLIKDPSYVAKPIKKTRSVRFNKGGCGAGLIEINPLPCIRPLVYTLSKGNDVLYKFRTSFFKTDYSQEPALFVPRYSEPLNLLVYSYGEEEEGTRNLYDVDAYVLNMDGKSKPLKLFDGGFVIQIIDLR